MSEIHNHGGLGHWAIILTVHNPSSDPSTASQVMAIMTPPKKYCSSKLHNP
ncbi:MAG: hypothetical protein WCO45_01380 [Pseudanabaena sp. ELA607]